MQRAVLTLLVTPNPLQSKSPERAAVLRGATTVVLYCAVQSAAPASLYNFPHTNARHTWPRDVYQYMEWK